MTLLLVASVGGSPAPIVSALRDRHPDFVLFVVTEGDTRQPGSADQIPAILDQIRRPDLPYEMLCVPPDDPEKIFLDLRERVRALCSRFAAAKLLFDYTGGTKSMTSALFQCALATPRAELQFMAGRRETLQTVTDGTERPSRIPVDWLLAERTEERLRGAWQNYSYGECARGVARLLDNLEADEKAPRELLRRLQDLREAAGAFDAWDRFDHKAAATKLHALAVRHPALSAYASQAALCAREESARHFDLWRNAERRAARGRYDDAVARCYRLIEATGQWLLRHRHDIDSSALDWNRIDTSLAKSAGIEDRRGKKTLSGLMQTLKLAAALEPHGSVRKFLSDPYPGQKRKDGEGRLRDMLDQRNHSILAHGTTALTGDDWRKWSEFMHYWWKSLLLPLIREAGLPASEPAQLPDEPPPTL